MTQIQSNATWEYWKSIFELANRNGDWKSPTILLAIVVTIALLRINFRSELQG